MPALAAIAVCAGVAAARLCGSSHARQALAVAVVTAGAVLGVFGTVRHQSHEISGHAQIAAEMRESWPPCAAQACA